ncbi:type II toxin-antitoxin system PemK/MazF family toxin [Bacillus litorisediminis]|uniref:type II toxin-antitoxin system PemK/MazF family toxin n=1 Tax=Bacillus litorisediminis TaxID=2922713 RepID=UPI001FB002C3|nr:type II toxin-antitoxin system PemK/MazF family toxin [Bacillus litorisediminis]
MRKIEKSQHTALKTVNKRLLGKIDALKGEILSLDSYSGELYAVSFLKMLTTNKHHDKEKELKSKIKLGLATKESLRDELRQVEKKNFPYNLQHGEIIHVDYGMGIADELRKGHYSVILSRKGEMFLVAPLTSQEQYYGKHTLFFENLNLPTFDGKDRDKSYVSFSQIRYVHSRRITKINHIDPSLNGRLSLDKDSTKKILQNYFNIINEGIEER